MGRSKIVTSIFVFLLGVLVILNLLNCFVPEKGFDALWYHLTLPKLYLLKHQWFIPGGLFYYSVMPRLAETIFIPLIKYTGYIGPKLLQFLSGIGVCVVMYKIGGLVSLTVRQKIVAISIFYGTWLVSWQSSSAYIDLIRTFFEISAIYLAIKNKKMFAGILLGLAVGTKWLSISSVVIYGLVFGPPIFFVAMFYSLPWFFISYFYTGNPIYPILSSANTAPLVDISELILRIIRIPIYLIKPFDDYLSPLMFILPAVSFIATLQKNKVIKQISIIGILGTISVFFMNPPSTRFYLPYLPMLSISSVYVFSQLPKKVFSVFQLAAFFSLLTIVIGRMIVFSKNLPFLLGRQSVNQYLESNRDRLPSTFIDSDNFVTTNLKPTDKILIDKIHNLYYFPYNFDHTTWASLDQGYDYLITQDTHEEQKKGKLIHTNSVGIQIYKLKDD